MPKPDAMTPAKLSSTARNASVSACTPPSLVMNSCELGLLMNSPTLEAMLPSTAPTRAKPTAHPRNAPPWSRHARARGVRSRGEAVAGPGRVGTTPAPRSRLDESANAHAETATAKLMVIESTHQRLPAYGRNCCPQPIGESQLNQRGPVTSAVSPTARRM
jgi:hypothetical protein